MPQPELRGKQGHVLPRGQMAARPGSSTAWGWTPKQHQSGGKGGQKPAPWSLGRWDGSRNQAELGQLQQGVAYPEFAPFPTQNTTSSGLQTQPSSGSLCAWRGEAALGRRSPHAWHMQQGAPSPGRGWGLLCVPRHSGGCSGCSPHQCHGHDPAGSAAGIQNLTQKRLGGHSPHRKQPRTRCPAGWPRASAGHRESCQHGQLHQKGNPTLATDGSRPAGGRCSDHSDCGQEGVQGCGGAWVQGCRDARGPCMHGCTGARIRVHMGAQAHGVGVH